MKQTFSINVISITNTKAQIEVNPEWNVKTLKEHLQNHFHIDSHLIILLFNNKALDNHQTIQYYNINESSTLHLKANIEGGRRRRRRRDYKTPKKGKRHKNKVKLRMLRFFGTSNRKSARVPKCIQSRHRLDSYSPPGAEVRSHHWSPDPWWKSKQTIKYITNRHKRTDYSLYIRYNRNLWECAELGYTDGIRYSLNCGAYIESKDWMGYTPLLIATEGNNFNSVKFLLDRNANVNVTCPHLDQTPLHRAVISNQIEVVKLLIPRDIAAMNYQDYLGNTPLHYAAYRQYIDIVDLLIEKGADLLIKNNDGVYPYEITNYGAVRKLLIRKTNEMAHDRYKHNISSFSNIAATDITNPSWKMEVTKKKMATVEYHGSKFQKKKVKGGTKIIFPF